MKLPNLKRLQITEYRIQNKNQKSLIGNRKPIFGLFVVLVFICSIGGIFVLQAQAQGLTVQTFTVTPPSVSVSLNPGGKSEGTMGVINDSDVPITFKADVHDFIVQDNYGTPEILPPNTLINSYSAAAWIGVTPDVFTIQPGKRQNLNYYIQIPPTAKPGGHYAAVVFVPVTSTGTPQNTGASVNGKIGTLFSITVNGQIKESASVTQFLTNVFQEYGPVNISTQIKNFGDLHIKPQGYITVTDMLGRQAILPLAQYNIFPMAARDYQNTFGTHFMIGRYKAVLLASYGIHNNLPLTATVYFWVFPWKIAVVIILILIALILGFLYYRKNGLKMPKGKSAEKAAEKPEEKEEPKTEEKSS